MPPGLLVRSRSGCFLLAVQGFGAAPGYPKKLPSSNFPAGLFCNFTKPERVTRVLEKLPVPGYGLAESPQIWRLNESVSLGCHVADLTHSFTNLFLPWGFYC